MTVHLRFFVPFFASVLKQIKVCDEDVLMRRDFLVNPSFEERKKAALLAFFPPRNFSVSCSKGEIDLKESTAVGSMWCEFFYSMIPFKPIRWLWRQQRPIKLLDYGVKSIAVLNP